MLKNIFLSLFFFLVTNSFAQKKMIPISQSPLTGISLPTGTKQDSRILSVAGAKMLLEMESKKANITVSSPEVLVLPPVTAGGFNADSLVKNLSDQGWSVSVIEGDNKYAWLQKDSRNLIMYFSMGAKETGLYFAEATSAPVQNGGGNTTGTIQTAPAETNQTQQTTNTVIQTNQPEVVQTNNTEVVQQPTPPVANSGFAFTTTNFDDGWTATVQENWVQVTKGKIKVLLHYPNAITGKYYSDSDEGINAAWNNLIAPRYNNLQNYTAWYSTSILPRPFVIAGNVTDKQSGEKVYVILFRKGSTDWIEIIAPDKNTFITNFGVDNTTLNNYADPKLFVTLEKLAVYNEFAIAATDLIGKWSDKFSASFFNYNTGSGQYTGINTIASVSNFIFTSATTYNWDAYSTNNAHSAGSAKTFKTKGSFKIINNRQIQFSDIQGKQKTYNAYFSCFKGGRILWLQDIDYGGYMAFGKVE
jgi:hypothetical protein